MYNYKYKISYKDYLILAIFGMLLISLSFGNAYYIFIGFIFSFLVYQFTSFRSLFDKNARCLLIFSISYGFFSLLTQSITNIPFIIYIGIVPVFFYIFGKHLSSKVRSTSNLSDLFVFLHLCLSQYILRLALTGQQFNNLYADIRALVDSEGNILYSATGVGVLVSLGLVGLSVALFVKSLSVFRKILWAILFLISLYVVTFFINRTGIIIGIICVALLSLFELKNSIGRFFIILIIGACLFSFFNLLGGIDSSIIDQYRSRSLEDERSRLWVEAIPLLFLHPFGFHSITSYVHNLWLDVARNAGLIPFVFLMIVTIKTLFSLKRILKERSDYAKLLLCLFICMTLSVSVEPIISAVPSYFLIYLFLFGIIHQRSHSIK